MEESVLQDIVVIYHAHCPDGMAAAWSAWKKFGDTASYLPCSDRREPPLGLTEKEIYILDFSYSKEVLQNLERSNKKVVVLDHHISAKDDVLSVEGGIFDINRSGAGLSWDYFFPNSPRPQLVNYIEKGDMNPHNLPDGEHLSQRIIATPFTISAYDTLIKRYEEDPASVIHEGEIINLYVDQIFDLGMNDFEMVLFEGYTIPAINIALPQTTKSQLLLKMYTKIPPLAMSYRFENGFWKVSLRSDGSVDCSLLAAKYGGGGHKGAAGFVVKDDLPLPFAKATEKKPE